MYSDMLMELSTEEAKILQEILKRFKLDSFPQIFHEGYTIYWQIKPENTLSFELMFENYLFYHCFDQEHDLTDQGKIIVGILQKLHAPLGKVDKPIRFVQRKKGRAKTAFRAGRDKRQKNG